MTFILICLHGDWMLECMNEKTKTYVEHAINFQRYAFCLKKKGEVHVHVQMYKYLTTEKLSCKWYIEEVSA